MGVPANSTFTEIVTSTLENRKGELADVVSNTNAILRALGKRGKISLEDGGRTIVREINYAANSTAGWYDGNETLGVNPSEVLSAAEYQWKQCSAQVVMSGREKRINSGEFAVFKLVEGRINNAARSLGNLISSGLYSDGTGANGKQVSGLTLHIADDPTTGTLGGINRANYPVWRNRLFRANTDGGAVAATSNIQNYFERSFRAATRGNEMPDVVIADSAFFGFYAASLLQQVRLAKDEGYGVDGRNLMFYGAEVYYEESSAGITANRAYFINSNYLELVVHKDANVSPAEDRLAVNQDSMVIPVLWMGQLVSSNPRMQAVMTNG